MDYKGFDINWDGHGSVRVNDEDFSVCVDPFHTVTPEDADAGIILVTSELTGYYDEKAIQDLSSSGTCVVLPEFMKPRKVPFEDVEYIAPGEVIDIYGVEIEAVKTTDKDGVSYRFRMSKTDFYVSGDTGFVEDLIDLDGRVDVAFISLDGVNDKKNDEFVKMAVRMKPSLVIPYLYGEPIFDELGRRPYEIQNIIEDRNMKCKVLK